MQQAKKENAVNLDGINLLVSILLRYPEIGTISFEPKNNSLKLTFMLDKLIADSEFAKFKKLLLNSIIAYHYLEKINDAKIEINTALHSNTLFIHIIRDIRTISQNEIRLISTLMVKHFPNTLITDEVGAEQAGLDSVQEEVIDHMLGNVKMNQLTERIVGIWEEGRVLVFNK